MRDRLNDGLSRNKGIIRIEPSPYASIGKNKIKMSVKSVNAEGQAEQQRTSDGKLEYVMRKEDVTEIVNLPGTVRVICPANGKNGLITGLSKLVDNPYSDLPDGDYVPEWGAKHLKGKDKVLLQTVLEYEHNKEFNYYRPNFTPVVTNAISNIDDVPYYGTSRVNIYLDNNVLLLDLSQHEEELKYYLALVDPRIANSWEELEKDRSSYKWVIVDEQAKEKSKAVQEELDVMAAAALADLKNDATAMRHMSRILGADVIKSTEGCFSYVYNYYKQSENKYNEFMLWYKKYKDIASREEFVFAAVLEDYIDNNVIRRRDNKYFFTIITENNSQSNFEWNNKDHIVKGFFLAPEYKSEREILKGYLDNQMSMRKIINN